jgi:hypothetical protein
MPFPIRAVQVDGGSEFAAEFEQACQQRGLRLFVLPPRSPKLNGAVERAQRTHTQEFYEVNDCSLEMAALNRELRQWKKTYNTVRPHQSLGYLTPLQFLQQWHSERTACMYHPSTGRVQALDRSLLNLYPWAVSITQHRLVPAALSSSSLNGKALTVRCPHRASFRANPQPRITVTVA